MVVNFLTFILALTMLVGAMLTFKVALNTGRKLATIKELADATGNSNGKPKKGKRGADRNFEPSKYS